MGSHAFVGRRSELETIDDWADAEGNVPAMCVEDMTLDDMEQALEAKRRYEARESGWSYSTASLARHQLQCDALRALVTWLGARGLPDAEQLTICEAVQAWLQPHLWEEVPQ